MTGTGAISTDVAGGTTTRCEIVVSVKAIRATDRRVQPRRRAR
jgi:hypothetical protein